MSRKIKFDQIIQNALKAVDASKIENRIGVYEGAKNALEATLRKNEFSPEKADALWKGLTASITKIEEQYATESAGHSNQTDESYDEVSHTQYSEPSSYSDSSMVEPPESLDSIVFDNEQDETSEGYLKMLQHALGLGDKIRLAIIAVLLLVSFVLIGWFFTNMYTSTTAISENSEPAAPPSPKANENIEQTDNQPVSISIDFSKGLDVLEIRNKAELPRVSVDTENQELIVKGTANVLIGDYLEIDRNKEYFVSLSVKLADGVARKNANFIAGFATYDGDKKLETEAPGTHRYFLGSGPISPESIIKNDGWILISGSISGAGPRSNAFRSTTKYARLFILFNNKNENVEIKVRDISIVEL